MISYRRNHDIDRIRTHLVWNVPSIKRIFGANHRSEISCRRAILELPITGIHSIEIMYGSDFFIAVDARKKVKYGLGE